MLAAKKTIITVQQLWKRENWLYCKQIATDLPGPVLNYTV